MEKTECSYCGESFPHGKQFLMMNVDIPLCDGEDVKTLFNLDFCSKECARIFFIEIGKGLNKPMPENLALINLILDGKVRINHRSL